MNEFAIFAHGTALDVDAFMSRSSLRVDRVWRLGDPKGSGQYKTSGVWIDLGMGAELTFWAQEEIAYEYVRDNRQQLLALGQFQGVETFILGVQFNVQLDESTVGFTVDFAHRLMELALEIGVRLVAYVNLVRIEDTEKDD